MLDKTYQASAVEGRRYASWERSGGFAARLHLACAPVSRLYIPGNNAADRSDNLLHRGL